MISEMAKAYMVVRVAVGLVVAVVFFTASPLAGQSSRMNFFVALEGATYGADRPALGIRDAFCFDEAYAEGFGALNWRAYLTGTSADGEADQHRARAHWGGPLVQLLRRGDRDRFGPAA